MKFSRIQFTDSLSRTKKEFVHDLDKPIKLYVCGVTPYDYSHIGHGRSYVNFDILVRFLRSVGYKVTYVRNVTDIDDKILARAAKEYGNELEYRKVSEFFTQSFQEDLAQLACCVPDVEPLVTTHSGQIISFIEKLVQKGSAYQVGEDIYFDVSSFPSYGQLSGKKVSQLRAGARIDINDLKKSPEDFVLWKGNKESLFWKSPWGYGRPGWHIECSVLAKEYLGETLDIHGGGADLIFPHHENECAQSESLHEKPLSRFWLHNALLNIDKEKMSKSLGNIFSLRDIYKEHDPMVLRYYFLQHHYRTPIEFTAHSLVSAQSAYKKLIHLFDGIELQTKQRAAQLCLEHEACLAMANACADDLNTPRVLGILFEHIEHLKRDRMYARCVKQQACWLLGLTFAPLAEDRKEITPVVAQLIEEREKARHAKNWVRADELRDELRQQGYEINDKKI